MSEDKVEEKPDQSPIVSDQHISLPPIRTIFTFLILILLLYALFSGLTFQFYASFLFLFYRLIKRMWIAVVCLGFFQTLLMVPFRIINLRHSLQLKEFEDKIEGFEIRKEKHQFLKKSFRAGERTFLWYVVNFFIQTISYLSIGRLFLEDFYSRPLDPKLLYSFVPYPQYPIQDTFFKIPYLVFTKTIDLGMDKVFIFWGIVIVYKLLMGKILPFIIKKAKPYIPGEEEPSAFNLIKKFIKKSSGLTVLLLILGWLILRNFPIGWQIRIFSGDVSKSNPTFNLITAIMTFLILLWLDFPKINEKVKLAKAENIDPKAIRRMQKSLFKGSFQKALILGLGAYFITNMIPCAFELSIFTLEIISFLSPLTLDKLIFRTQIKVSKPAPA